MCVCVCERDTETYFLSEKLWAVKGLRAAATQGRRDLSQKNKDARRTRSLKLRERVYLVVHHGAVFTVERLISSEINIKPGGAG